MEPITGFCRKYKAIAIKSTSAPPGCDDIPTQGYLPALNSPLYPFIERHYERKVKNKALLRAKPLAHEGS